MRLCENSGNKWNMCKLFHYKRRRFYIFVDLCSKFFPIFSRRQNRTREKRENTLSRYSRFIFFFMRRLPVDLLGGWITSSATKVSDDLASVEREEHNVHNVFPSPAILPALPSCQRRRKRLKNSTNQFFRGGRLSSRRPHKKPKVQSQRDAIRA